MARRLLFGAWHDTRYLPKLKAQGLTKVEKEHILADQMRGMSAQQTRWFWPFESSPLLGEILAVRLGGKHE